MPKRKAEKPTGPVRRPRPLTLRQHCFAELLATWAIAGKDPNYAEAARQAGYRDSRAARKDAARLAQDPRVRALLDAALEKARDSLERKHGVTRERILAELEHVGFARLADVASWDDKGVKLHPSASLSERAHAAVAEVRQDEKGVKVKMHRKTEALLAAARLAGYLKDDDPDGVKGVQIIVNGGPTGLEVTVTP